MSNISNIPISHYKVLSLPSVLEPNSVYYVLDQKTDIVKGYITSKYSIPIPIFTVSTGGFVNSVTGTAVTGTLSNPKINIANFLSSQLGNLVYLSSIDGKLQVNPITSPEGSLEITSTATELQIELSAAITSEIQSALQPGDNISELINDVGYITLADIEGTDLTYTATPINGIVISSTGNDTTIPLATIVYAGLLEPSDKAKLNNITNVNSGDQTSIIGISGTKSEFNNSLTDGNFVFTSDIIEIAQDAVGEILAGTSTIDLTYNDAIPSISASIKPNSISATELVDNINISEFVNDSSYETTSQLNTRDINNRTRVNHTGMQAISTIVNLQTELDSKINLSEKASANGVATLDANGKIPLVQINDAILGNLKWKGLYSGIVITSSPDAPLNGTALPTPSVANIGWYFIANADFTYLSVDYRVGDWIISNGVVWDKVDNTDAISSVFGRTGNITAQNGDYNTGLVTEVTNKNYQTDNQKLFNDATSSIQTQINLKENTSNKQNSLAVDGTGVKFPTVDAVNAGLATKGTVASISGINGVTVVTGTTTPVIGLGAITPTSINTSGNVATGNLYVTGVIQQVSGNITTAGTITGSNLSGTNTGDNAKNTQYSGLVSNATHTGDVTGSTVLTLATVSVSQGTFGDASKVAQSTVNIKGLTTAISSIPIQIAESQVTGLVADLAGKEPAFTKNTAFNKNFGTTVGTVAQGNDSRLSDSRNPLSGSTNYIQNGTTKQTANLNISGKGIFGSIEINNPKNGTWTSGEVLGSLDFYANDISSEGASVKNYIRSVSEDSFGAAFDLIFGTSDGLTGAVERFRIKNMGESVFSSSVTATNFLGNWNSKGTGDFIQNQNASAQSANMWINGVGRFNTHLQLGTASTMFVGDGSTISGTFASTEHVVYNTGGNLHLLASGGVGLKILASTGAATFSSSVTATGFFNSSDRRLKTIIKRDGNVAYFKWKDGRDSKTHIGYIAQEVRKTNPDQVQKGEDKMLSVNYVEILVEKVQALEKRVKQLEYGLE